jgi:hypothetical protein
MQLDPLWTHNRFSKALFANLLCIVRALNGPCSIHNVWYFGLLDQCYVLVLTTTRTKKGNMPQRMNNRARLLQSHVLPLPGLPDQNTCFQLQLFWWGLSKQGHAHWQ